MDNGEYTDDFVLLMFCIFKVSYNQHVLILKMKENKWYSLQRQNQVKGEKILGKLTKMSQEGTSAGEP